jgi:hypothetical protein
MAAVLNSLKRAGICVEKNTLDADAVIIWSVLFAGRMSKNQQVYEHYRQQNKPVIVIDIGALYRGETWKIALNNITAAGYYGHQEHLDSDRPRKLGISLALNFSRNPNIVVAAQHKSSLQVNDINMEDWIVKQIEQLRTVTDRPIIVRPHPRCPLNMFSHDQSVTLEEPRKIANTYDSYNLVFDCHAMVNYNSGPGIQAALAGTRPIVDVTSLAHPVGIDIQNIDQPYTIDRDQWLIEICHTEYTLKEIEQGTWLQRLSLV